MLVYICNNLSKHAWHKNSSLYHRRLQFLRKFNVFWTGVNYPWYRNSYPCRVYTLFCLQYLSILTYIVTSVKRSNTFVCTVARHCVCPVLQYRLTKLSHCWHNIILTYISITFLLRIFSLLIKFIFVIKWIQAFSHKNIIKINVNWKLFIVPQ